MPEKVTFEEKAILKILLHASRHTASSICGLCLGKTSGDEKQITDAVPLFHTQAVWGPLLQTAIVQVSKSPLYYVNASIYASI
jgi:hypothetical protein